MNPSSPIEKGSEVQSQGLSYKSRSILCNDPSSSTSCVVDVEDAEGRSVGCKLLFISLRRGGGGGKLFEDHAIRVGLVKCFSWAVTVIREG